MPLHLIFQCCKCKKYLCHDIWSIARNHKYSDSKYVCQHFNVIIDHESSCGFLGIGWRNKITIEAYCKTYYDTKTVFSKTFNKNYTEHQSYARFNNLVCHARISDYRGNYPNCGFNLQNEIEYNEKLEQQRREERERQREMERRRQYERDLTAQLEAMIERGRNEEAQHQNELTILKEECNKTKKKFKSHIKLIELDIGRIFEQMFNIQIEKL